MVAKYCISIVSFLLAIGSFAGESVDSHLEGVKAFKAKKYDEAIQSFEKDLENNPNNVAAYFNLGLSYNAQKEYGKAIWAFEKVLKITPNNPEAVENIEQNYLELDNGQEWSSQLSHFERVLYGMKSNNWAYISLFVSFLVALLFFFFLKAKDLSKKRIFLVSAVFSLSIMLFAIYVASSAHNYENDHSFALVTKTTIPTLQDNDAVTLDKDQILLKAGTRVEKVGNHKDSIIKIETSSGQTYLVNKEDVDFI
ncbi:MAG: tetratricopeptide (TPR) repeat protein [Salibacteraceae bacterium]|jgi:tetratricopeptide (TPR) repeat protein